MKTIIIIPTYNEKNNVESLVEQIFSLNISGLEILFIDDNSPDGTADTIKKMQIKHPIHLIQRPKKLGIGSAYLIGFQKAFEMDADYIIEMDADLSHNPKDIPLLITTCANGADLTIGSRKIAGGKIEGWNLKRKLMSNGAMFFARLILNLKTKDVTAGFRCFKKSTLEKIDLKKIKSNGYAFQEEILFKVERTGNKVVEVPVNFPNRKHDQSKLNKKDIIEFFIVMLKLKFQQFF
ncbi:MAG: dolichyl-phosphate beta-D-mannosyltransferase [Candidatus Magasanikbacteria bacterium CG10_big_fil_rev_8_21_14_0_10_36_32]|uniref:Dolichyl-phosphate beta-D-mannosyltransferase n=1 Tax=Candidatus Magasanikbacteria bacterium CG10_big_fil_rev_8_21_14_0_10_36_32 TaxID=1974646 RepID=A0A2M6W5M7_9BACT|nr:MAG: dolichyl-phosphate beta-D-mannosyltransferase [Candidatus Magasanikbacteria bacterium CG10_big_fil_rev_8_21_14_0_10_36_32]